MPLLRRVSVLAAGIEATSGTPETLDATDGVFNVFNAEIQPQFEFLQRERQGSFSPLSGRVGARMGTCTFSVELTGDGSAGIPAWASVFLPACAWTASSQTYTPKSEAVGSNVKTLTINKYENGLLKQISGAMGTFTLSFPTGRICMINFTFTGIYDETPTDTAIVAPNYPDNLAIRFASATFTIGGFAAKVSNVSIDAGNQVVMREDAAQSSGYVAALVTGRRMTGSLDPELDLVATKDWHNEWTQNTEQALSLIVGAANNRVTIAAPKLQFTNLQESSRNDIMTESVEFQLNGSADAGNDECSITFD